MAIAGAVFLLFLVMVAVFAPLIVKLFGSSPYEFHPELIDTEGLTELNAQVEIEQEDASAVATAWLEENGVARNGVSNGSASTP